MTTAFKKHTSKTPTRQALEKMGLVVQAPTLPPDNVFGVELFDRDLKVKRASSNSPKVRGNRTKIFSFTKSSQRNLLTTCRNSGHHIQSQFTCTYHEFWPTDGAAIKLHMANFRKRLVRQFGKDIHFVWCLEFQKRGAPHFHFFSDLPHDRKVQAFLALAWVEVSGGSTVALDFHNHPNCFIAWNMKSGAYLAKEYIGKVEQKHVPENFHDVGRFWGASRNMKPRSTTLYLDLQDAEVVEKVRRVLRIITKHQEKKVCSIKRIVQAVRWANFRLKLEGKPKPIKKICLRNKRQSVTLHHLAPMFMTLLTAAAMTVGKLPTFC